MYQNWLFHPYILRKNITPSTEHIQLKDRVVAISGFAPPIVKRWAVEGVGEDDKSTFTPRRDVSGRRSSTRTKSLQITSQQGTDLYRQHDSGSKTRVLTDLYRRHELGV